MALGLNRHFEHITHHWKKLAGLLLLRGTALAGAGNIYLARLPHWGHNRRQRLGEPSFYAMEGGWGRRSISGCP